MKNLIMPLTLPSATVRAALQLPGALVCCGALALLAGCATEPESHLVSAPPPAAPTTRAVTTTTTTTTAPVTVPVATAGNVPARTNASTAPIISTTIVTQAPPELQQEVVLAQPSAQHKWVPGYWTWRNERYEWMAGHWELPPSSTSVWVAPRWEQQGNAFKFYEGYWN